MKRSSSGRRRTGARVSLLARERKGQDIRVKALQGQRLGQGHKTEAFLDNGTGGITDHRATWRRECGQPRGEVDRFAHGHTSPHHHGPGNDADANLQLQLRHGF